MIRLGVYSKDLKIAMAKKLEEYMDMLDLLVISDSFAPSEYEKCCEKVRKAIKKLKKGKEEGVLNFEKMSFYRHMLERELLRNGRE